MQIKIFNLSSKKCHSINFLSSEKIDSRKADSSSSMFPSPVNSNSSSTCSSASYNNSIDDGRALRPIPCEFKPPADHPKPSSPFLRGPPITNNNLLFLQPVTPKTSSSTSSEKKKPANVSYVRIWTELYDVYTRIERINDIVPLSPINSAFFQSLFITNSIQITYSENFPLISNMLQLLKWSPECRFIVSARGFCEDFMTFLKTLPSVNGILMRDVCSNESINFDELLEVLTNADELEIDMAHIKYKEDPGEILLKWKRPATLKKFILYNLVRGISTSAVQTFCQDKIVPGGVISVTYEKYPREQQQQEPQE